jgi:transcription elongation factor GreA
LRKQAQDAIAARDPRAVLIATMADKLGEFAGVEDGHEELHSLLKHAKDIVPLFKHLKQDDLLERACKALAEARPDRWRNELVDLLPALPHTYCDRAVEWLIQAGCTRTDLEPVVQKIIAAPAPHFGALLWLWDGPTYSELSAGVSPVTVLSRILRALADSRRVDAISRDQEKEMSQSGRSVLAARGYAQLDKCLNGIDPGMAVALRTQVNQVENLGRTVTNQLLRKIGAKIPPREAEPAVMPWAREDIVYTTEAGFARKQDEIDHHVNVKMKENAKAIGLAAEKGDLSENSEYKFALEERDLLRARLAQMNSELQDARVMSPGEVPTDHIGIGTRAVFKRVTDGSPYEMTFVGPWDADHERGLYNYKAPLAQTILGKRVGDRMEFTHSAATGTYEVAELHNGLLGLDTPTRVQRAPSPDYSKDVGE